jgi:signal transduction histidine kinase
VAAGENDNRPLVATAAVAIALTAAVAGIPFLRFAYDNHTLHVALETGEGLIALLLAFLSVGRFRASGRPADLILGTAFGVLGATNLLLSVGPNVAAQDRAVGFAIWAAAGLRLTGAAGIAIAAALGDRMVPWARVRRGLASGAVVVAAVLVLAAIADRVLDHPIDPTVEATASNRPTLIGHPLLLAIQVLGFATFASAAVAFARTHPRRPLDGWLATGCVIAAFSRIHYFLFSSLYTSWVSTGDVLRLGSYLAFLAGAAVEIQAYWRAQSALAAAEERGRIARDLHDGLAQELSFIRSQTIGDERSGAVAEAAGRALLESRRLIRALSGQQVAVTDALHDALVAVTRAGVALEVDAGGPGVDQLGADLQAALVGIAREAGGNAVRHGRPATVRVSLMVELGARSGCLAVTDDGAGFDPVRPSDGFGLSGMRARAQRVGAVLDVRSSPGRGTTVTVTW